jgi:hypothetical protein
MTIRRLGIMLVSVVAVYALSVSVAAAAEVAEFGECVKVKTGGEYSNGSCTKSTETGTGKYDWVVDHPASDPFAAASTSPTLLATGAVSKRGTHHYPPGVSCAANSMSGDFTGPTTLAVAVVFTGCETVKETCYLTGCETEQLTCQSDADEPGVIATGELEGTLGMISAGKPGVLFDTQSSSNWSDFTCVPPPPPGGPVGYPSFSATLGGAAIAKIGPLNRPEFTLTFRQQSAKQIPTSFEEGPSASLLMNVVFPSHEEQVQVGIAVSDQAQTSETPSHKVVRVKK